MATMVSFCNPVVTAETNVDGDNDQFNKVTNESSSPPALRRRSSHLIHRYSMYPLDYNSIVEDEIQLKTALYNHICNPLKRWKVANAKPYKLFLQIVKTVLVLVQVFLFAYFLANERVYFYSRSQELLQNLLLRNKVNKLSLYNDEELNEDINFITNKYFQLPNITLGGYNHQLDSDGNMEPITATVRQYQQIDIESSSDSIVFNQNVITTEINITEDSDPFLQLVEEGFAWNQFIDARILLYLKKVHIVKNPDRIDCYLITITVLYSNEDHSGIIDRSLNFNFEFISCNTEVHNDNKARNISWYVFTTLLDVLVIILSVISNVFIIIKYWRGYKLAKAMREFYKKKLEKDLKWTQIIRPLFSLWLSFTLLANVLLIIGSLLRITLEFNASSFSFRSASVRILLGTAALIEMSTILRYISFFNQLNALPRTLSYVLPDLLKFLLCTGVLFFAFSICGFVIFGPYNERFSDIFQSFQSLFVLTNGDDIYPMFRSFDDSDNNAVKAYGQVFIYVFTALFVYAVLNLFTSLIIRAHEESKTINRAIIDEVRRFIYSGKLTKGGGALKEIMNVNKIVDSEVVKGNSSDPTNTD